MDAQRTIEESCNQQTFCKLLNRDIVKLFYNLHYQLWLVNLDDNRRAALVSFESEFTEGILDILGNIDSLGLRRVRFCVVMSVSPLMKVGLGLTMVVVVGLQAVELRRPLGAD